MDKNFQLSVLMFVFFGFTAGSYSLLSTSPSLVAVLSVSGQANAAALAPVPAIAVTAPKGGSTFKTGAQMKIVWSEKNFIPKDMVIYLSGSALAGQPVPTLARLGSSKQLSYVATVPAVPSGTDYVVSVCDEGTPSPVANYKPLCGNSKPFTIVSLVVPTPLKTCNLDVDGNGVKDALTDGLLIQRYMFGLRGSSLTTGAIGASATRTTSTQIEAFIAQQDYDVDGNRVQDALTDGLLISRYLFGLTGDSLVYNAVGTGATRTSAADILTWLNACAPLPSSTVSIVNATSVPSQNISTGVPKQPLGGFSTTVTGEPVIVRSVPVRFTYGNSNSYVVSGVILLNESGTTVAGPFDTVAATGSAQLLNFTDTITLPVGTHTWIMRGNIASLVPSTTIVAYTNPAEWGSPTGQLSGKAVSLNNSPAFYMSQMNIKTASLSVALGHTPSQTITGGNSVLFANVQLSAAQSGEDIRLSSLPLRLTLGGTAATNNLTSCQLFNGTTALNTGSNVPTSVTSGSATTFSFDTPLTIIRGTIMTLAFKCNVSPSALAGSTYTWGINASDTFPATGSLTGSPAGVAVTTGNSGTMMVGTATLSAAVDSSTPSYQIVAGGDTGITLGVYRLRASVETAQLQTVRLRLMSGAPSDLTSVRLYAGNILIGVATFTAGSFTATSTLTTPVLLPNDVDISITAKGDIAPIGIAQSGTSGALIKVELESAKGITTSGRTVSSLSTYGVAGVRMFKSYPTFIPAPVSSNGIADGRLLRFGVMASPAGSVGLTEMRFNIATSGIQFVDARLYAYSDIGYSTPVAGFPLSGVPLAIYTNTLGMVSLIPPLQVPPGSTRYFELRGTAVPLAMNPSVTTTLVMSASSSNPILGPVPSYVREFLWSPNSTTTAARTNYDWTNSYGLYSMPGVSWTRTQ